jgi:hypothetical protein
MIGRRALAGGWVASLAWARGSSARGPQPWTLRPIEHRGFDWRLVAQSDLIVRGILAIPAETASLLKQSGEKTASIPLAVGRVFKGAERRRSLELRYPRIANCGRPAPHALAALNARDAILCLTLEPTPPAGPPYYLADCSREAATGFSDDTQRRLLKEIDSQRSTARHIAGALANDRLPFEASVEAAIGAALAGDNQSALRGLRRSGLAAAPAMIRRLDDRRPLPQQAISVSLAGSFEGLSHYSVGEVGDLLMFALGLMTKDVSFGFPFPQTSDAQRERMADAWRVWLGYSLEMDQA